MYEKRSLISVILGIIIALLAFYTSLIGIIDDSIYKEVYEAGTIQHENIWGSVAQDIISLPFSLILLVLSFIFIKRGGLKTFISILGLIWYFFYAYGLYVIQGQYTDHYIIYLAIFGLSIYGLIFGVISVKEASLKLYDIPKGLKRGIIIYLAGTVLFLGPIWTMTILNDISSHAPSRTYAVPLLDLSIVFPAFVIICILLIKKHPLGNALAGIAIFKGFTLCLSWAFSELSGPSQENPFNPEMALTSSTLTLIGLVLFIPYMIKLKKH